MQVLTAPMRADQRPMERRPTHGWRDADLRDRGTTLHRADMRWHDLRGADMRHLKLCGTDFSGADLRGTDLRGADMRGVILYGADLDGARLAKARLYGAYGIMASATTARAQMPGDIVQQWVTALTHIRRTEAFELFANAQGLHAADVRKLSVANHSRLLAIWLMSPEHQKFLERARSIDALQQPIY